MLAMQIQSDAYRRQGKAVTNFALVLPGPQSDLAQQILKDPYIFDFLTLEEPFHERELETNLIRHIEKFLLELGQGFAFVGRQYRLVVGKDDFHVDLLFYHLKLRAFVVNDLKTGDFKPEHAGKINFYCNVATPISCAIRPTRRQSASSFAKARTTCSRNTLSLGSISRSESPATNLPMRLAQGV